MNINLCSKVAQSFSGRYQLNANQNMKNGEACLKRDYFIGVIAEQSKNSEEVMKKLKDFYSGPYNNNQNAPCEIVLELPNAVDNKFEQAMNALGQKFSKLA